MEYIRTKKVRTRKKHKCFGCGRNFPKGNELQCVTTVDNGSIFDDYWCDVCVRYWEKFAYPGDTICQGDLVDEDWHEIRSGAEGGR